MKAIFRAYLTLIAGVVVAVLHVSPVSTQELGSTQLPWRDIEEIAAKFVDQETAHDVWPFSMPLPSGLSGSSRKTYIHYFTPLPISPDNKRAEDSYWNVQALRRNGLGGKYAAAGGYLRERPLPVGPWQSPYWRYINYSIDVLRAVRVGADGFFVGIFQLPHGIFWNAALQLCSTASKVAENFTIIPQLDADALVDASPQQMAAALKEFSNCPAATHFHNRLAVAVFDPRIKPLSFWRDFMASASELGLDIAFIPVVLNEAVSVADYAPLSYAIAPWGAADPKTALLEEAELDKLTSQFHFNLVAPIRSQDFRQKSEIVFEAGNTRTFRALWSTAIKRQSPFVHIITWNDYTESTEIEPSSRTQFLFYDLTAYFNAWFKSGSPPLILRDAIYYTHRSQIFDPAHPPRSGDAIMHLMGRTAIENNIELIALLTAPATISIKIGPKQCRQEAPAGLTVLTCPAQVGRPIFNIARQGSTILALASNWDIEANPQRADPLYVGGSSTRQAVNVPAPQ